MRYILNEKGEVNAVFSIINMLVFAFSFANHLELSAAVNGFLMIMNIIVANIILQHYRSRAHDLR